MNNVVTRAARRATRNVCGNGSLAAFKANAHRAARAEVNRTLRAVIVGVIDADDADYTLSPGHIVTAYEIA